MRKLTTKQIDFLTKNKDLVREAFEKIQFKLIDESDVEPLREQWLKDRSPFLVIAQRGGQENILSSEADITISGGCRGGSKTFSLLLEAEYDIPKNNFRAIILRKTLDDLSDIADTSMKLFDQDGIYNRSKNDMTWNFNAGGWLKFSYHDDEYQSFCDRFRGKQYAYIGIDEVTQIAFNKFKFLLTSNRNAYGIRNRIVGTCNPDPDSWVAKFISWWIGEDGLPIKERDGVIRYCFMPSDYVEDIVWGDTKEEVFEKCKDIILQHWSPEYNRYGTPEDLFIKSVCFTEAKLSENVALMSSDPSYLANLVNQSEEQRARDLDGNWKYKSVGEDVIKLSDMENFYSNAEQRADEQRYMTADVAFDGGDQCFFVLWVGNHIEDMFFCQRNSKDTIATINALLDRWRVRQENFAYDLLGVGQVVKGFFQKAIPYNAREAVEEKYRGMYYNLNAQVAYYFADHIKDGTYSINPDLLNIRISGKGYKNITIKERLNIERRCINFRKEDKSRLVEKHINGSSPDIIDAIKMREIFNIKRIHHKPKNLGLITGASKNDARKYNYMLNKRWW